MTGDAHIIKALILLGIFAYYGARWIIRSTKR